MTVASGYTPTVATGNGVTTAFPTGFTFLLNAGVVVRLIRLSDDAETILVEGVHYTLTGAGVPGGGTLTTLPDIAGVFGFPLAPHPLSSGYQLRLTRSTPIVQDADLVNNDGDDAEIAEFGFDRLTMICQEIMQMVADAVSGAPGALNLANGTPPLSAEYTLPIYSGIVGTTHKLRVIDLGTSSLKAWQVNSEYVQLRDPGLDDLSRLGPGGILAGDTVDTGRGESVRQFKNGFGEHFITFWDGMGAADTKRWGFANPAPGELSLAALTDDMVSVVSPWMTWLRSGSTAFETRMDARLNINQKRVANIGALDFDESAKGTTGGAVTFDFSAFNLYSITLNANTTWTFTPPSGPTTTYIECTQSSGGHTVTLPAACKFTNATPAGDKLASTGAGHRDLYVFKWNAAGNACLTQIHKQW